MGAFYYKLKSFDTASTFCFYASENEFSYSNTIDRFWNMVIPLLHSLGPYFSCRGSKIDVISNNFINGEWL